METKKVHHYYRGPSMKATKDELQREVADTPDVSEFYTNAPTELWAPSLRLRFAVVEEAIALLKKGPVNPYSTGHERDYRDTVAWVEGRVESAPSFSLAEIAFALDFDLPTLKNYLLDIVDENRRLARQKIAC